MFILVAAWRRADPTLEVEDRISEAVSESAVSITITAITDALSFAIGCITTFPSVYLFCMYTSVAIVLTYIYQITFFFGLIVLYGRLERKGRHNVIAIQVVPVSKADYVDKSTQLFNLGTVRNAASDIHIRPSMSQRIFREWYSPILMHPIVKILVLCWMGVYLVLGAWGCSKVQQGLEPKKIMVSDSYAVKHYDNLLAYMWPYGTEVQVVVNNPPNFSHPGAIQEAWNIVRNFTNTYHTLDTRTVQFWLSDYEKYIKALGFDLMLENGTLSGKHIKKNFLSQSEYYEWINDLNFGNVTRGENPNEIASYRFIIATKNFHSALLQQDTLNLFRRIADRPALRKYNITTFYPLWHYADQYNLVLPNTLQNIGIATACMIIVSLMLIPHPFCAFWVAVSIASIDVGVIGFSSFWGLNLDIITMITIIMSIGFSVDFTAHICYGYVVSQSAKPADRVADSLGALGWPILQGAISTIIGIATLSNIDSYIIQTFFKTVFLVITIGLIHGLVFIPVLLSLLVRRNCFKGSA